MGNLTLAVVTAWALLAMAVSAAPPAAPPDPTARAADDAAAMYFRAAELIRAESPCETALRFPAEPPFGEKWEQLAKAAWDANQPVFDLARKARALKMATWLADDNFNKIRRVQNQLADAALYEHVHGQHAAAVELIRDMLHMADLLEERPSSHLIRVLVAAGVRQVAMNRFAVIAAGTPIVAAKANEPTQDLRADIARELIADLLRQRKPLDQLVEVVGPVNSPAWKDPKFTPERAIRMLTRTNGQRTFAAMSLACDLFRFETGQWPAALDQLTPAYLPEAPPDGDRVFEEALRAVRR
jgi:hypothetical protein